jgi:EmrB/QacA subfamily drug resistance transporter
VTDVETRAVAGQAPAPGHTSLSERQIRLVFGGLMLGLLLAGLDQTIVSTALPTIVGDLGGLNHLSWVVTAYLLTSTVSTPLWGKLGDLYGRKFFFQASIVIFIVGSVFAGVSQNLNELILCRAIQGLGAGGLIVGSQAIIGDIVPPRERGRYSGVIGATFAVSSVAGPLLGGFFTDSLTWRWVFYVNVPIAAVALFVVAAVLPARSSKRVQHKIDYLGSSLMTGSVVALILLLTWGGTTYAWGSATIISLAVVTVVLFVAFIEVEKRATEPIIPLRLFANRQFTLVFCVLGIVGFSMFGALTFVPLFLQVVHGASPTSSGLQMVPIMAFLLTAAIVSGRLMTRTGRYRHFPIIGTGLTALALYLFSHLGVTTPFWHNAIYMAVLGTGLGLTMQMLLLAAQNSQPYADLGVATSTATFARSMGGSVGVAIFGAIFNGRLAANLPKHVPAAALAKLHGADVSANPAAVKALPGPVRDGLRIAFSNSLHDVFLAGVPFAVIAFLLTLRLREVPLRTSHEGDGSTAEHLV